MRSIHLLTVFLISEGLIGSGFAYAQTTASAATPALQFNEACSKNDNIEIVAVGDILLHGALQRQAMKHSLRYKSLWSPLLPFIQKADVAYANLEGPAAENETATGPAAKPVGHVFDKAVYSSYPQFNYHPHLIEDIKTSGFDIVSTANNHSLDRRAIGIDKTLNAIIKNSLHFTGTRPRSESENLDYQWHTVTQSKGRNIAWLACTFSTNGISDRFNQVLPCFKNTDYLLNLVQKLARDPAIHAVIVTPHWGNEYELSPAKDQKLLGQKLIEAGATAVFGTHPHVVQPWEKVTTADGREGFIIYSTGNFVSGQPHIARETSVMVQLHLTGAPQAKLKIRGVSYLPLYMKRGDGNHTITPVFPTDEAPDQALKIWKKAFGTQQRIVSLQENQIEKICQSSQMK